ncbi:glycosyltransferase family 2 protein [Methylococcus sp. EFPC2]|uniref:glycosyltransferase family 2 protein n=1 Tax=Methylococcus sp. EFPC2 TaxID=2812648 RepID=UPI0019677AB4|nr:glycosyltransferase family 2 protein [Methylococcus sp. EFPC2]QSA98583.1 glycosyltransferase family 2 protein [Methylococcus sp. EFPC2]
MSKAITVVILTQNEERTLDRCLTAIPAGYPVVVLDSGSTDGTLAIAESLGARVCHHAWEGYAQQRNHALQHCSIATPWVLFIDADEVFSREFFDWADGALESELAEIDAVMVPSYFYLRGKRLSHAPGYPIVHARLLRRETVRFLSHHEGGFGENIQAGCRIAYASIPYEHYFYDGELLEWLHKHVAHANREIRVHHEGIILNPRKRLSLLLGNSFWKAPARFFYHYVLRGGFLDGKEGLEFSLMFAWYEFTKFLLARYANQ